MDYRTLGWQTGSDGKLIECEIEYNLTFFQWLFRRPATKRQWKVPEGKSWCLVEQDSDGEKLHEVIDDVKMVEELMRVLDHIRIIIMNERLRGDL